MPKYMLSVFGPAERNEFGDYPTKEDMLQSLKDTGAFNDKLQAEGYFLFADGLEQATTTATVVDGQGDQPVITDGPYLEAKEYLGDFWIIEAPTWTSRCGSPRRARRPAVARSRCGPSRPRSPSRRCSSRDRFRRQGGDHPGPP